MVHRIRAPLRMKPLNRAVAGELVPSGGQLSDGHLLMMAVAESMHKADKSLAFGQTGRAFVEPPPGPVRSGPIRSDPIRSGGPQQVGARVGKILQDSGCDAKPPVGNPLLWALRASLGLLLSLLADFARPIVVARWWRRRRRPLGEGATSGRRGGHCKSARSTCCRPPLVGGSISRRVPPAEDRNCFL